MQGDDWIDIGDWNDDEPRRPPAPPPIAGQRLVPVVCCPACQSLQISHYSTKADVSYWRCGTCAEAWKLPAGVGRDRAYLL